MTTSDNELDVGEQVNVLYKKDLGFPSTNETLPWFNETEMKYNTYIVGEDILLDEIPKDPQFVNSISPVDVGLTDANFAIADEQIHEDSTRTVRRYTKLILEAVPGSNDNSYYLLADGNNILEDSLQFNTKWDGPGYQKPYIYELTSINRIDGGQQNLFFETGNWAFDVKNGIIFFADYNASIVDPVNNRPVLTFYKYIGRKGINKLIEISDSQPPDPFKDQILLNTDSKKLQLWNGLTWDDYGGSEELETQLDNINPNGGDTLIVSGSVTAGRAKMGNLFSNSAAFGDSSNFNSDSYALLQTTGGDTYINAADGKHIYFRVNNSGNEGLNDIVSFSPQVALFNCPLECGKLVANGTNVARNTGFKLDNEPFSIPQAAEKLSNLNNFTDLLTEFPEAKITESDVDYISQKHVNRLLLTALKEEISARKTLQLSQDQLRADFNTLMNKFNALTEE